MAEEKTLSNIENKSEKEESVKKPEPSPLSSREQRIKLIRKIQEIRGSKVISYICGDRRGAPNAQIAEDAIRPMYDHVKSCGDVKKIDIFLYSKGGAIEVPWRMITMLREYCKHLSVLIPYHAQSAATLLALGCDEIVMGRKAELGPIDPALSFAHGEGTEAKEQIGVEDVMSFIRFTKNVAGLTDQAALTKNVDILTKKLPPWHLGKIYRTHSHIRMIAQRMLSCHAKKLDDQLINRVTNTLAEEIYSHGHAICRNEANDIGLPVDKSTPEFDALLWELLESYEDLMELRQPIDPQVLFPQGQDEVSLDVIIAVIESEIITSAFNGALKFKRFRETPANVNINLNVGVQLPPQITPESIPAAIQQSINQLINELKSQAPKWVMEQTKQQSPVSKIEGRFENAAWRDISQKGV